MTSNTTIVTAFFDINRETQGDGRKLSDYLEWIKKTLMLNCNLFIVTEPKFKDFFLENRPLEYKDKTVVHVMDFKESHYYRYYDNIKDILNDPYFKSRIRYPNRVECVLPEYNIVQYSKFHYLEIAIEKNHFNSDYFFWADAGISRFFLDVDLTKHYPSNNTQEILKNISNKFIIQKRDDLESYVIDENFIWGADNLLYGGMFGGSISIVKEISRRVEVVFQSKMLKNKNVNNEQLALAIVWKFDPQLFFTNGNVYNNAISLFKLLSL